MAFDWWDADVPVSVTNREAENRRQGQEDEVWWRASMLRRLGYDQKDALKRCLGNLVWGHEVTRSSPLTAKEVRAVVKNAYGR